MVFERSFRLNYLMWAKNNKFIAHKQRDFLFYFRTGQSFDYTLHSGLFCRLWLRLWINRFKMSFSIFFLISIAFNWRCQSLYAMHIYRRSLILTVDCWSCTKFICLEQTATITAVQNGKYGISISETIGWIRKTHLHFYELIFRLQCKHKRPEMPDICVAVPLTNQLSAKFTFFLFRIENHVFT